ncbi:MAG: pyridoxal-phosphate dependent enzyme, partial [Chitinophagaceae bacterium]
MIAGINALADLHQAIVQQVHLPLLAEKKCMLDVLRTDKIHATISGNKWFKLKYNLLRAMSLQKNTIVTMGGAYSNHLIATAYSCRQLNLNCVGIIRGEQPASLSPTLRDCLYLGMKLQFIDRESYNDQEKILSLSASLYPGSFFIEEGGCNALGIEGASEMAKLTEFDRYAHVCCALGTGTMMAGLVRSTSAHQHVTGISALKLQPGNSIEEFIESCTDKKNYTLNYDY